uniref:Lipocalin n=1 Tax=Rhipicephalus zambeziensis TaxID=60191 RepID=A0A224YCC4_9ACAR
MKLFLFVALIGVVYSDSGASNTSGQSQAANPDWAVENKFGKFQNAWATINATNVQYYMAKATYNNESFFGGRFSCLKVETKSTSKENLTVDATMTYKDEKNGTMSKNITTKAVTYYSYKTPNALQYGPKDKTAEDASTESGASTQTDVLVFSDPSKCDVVSTQNGKEFELWVHSDVKDDIPKCCLFLFDYFAREKSKYDIYLGSDFCTSPGTPAAAQ